MNHDLEPTFLATLHHEPDDETTWLALADWLEEAGQDDRARLVRLSRQLRALPVEHRTRERVALEEQLAELLRSGTRPAVAEVVNSLGMRLALLPPGRFRMGSPGNEASRMEEEGPMHEVFITRPFYLGVFEVTQGEFAAVMRNNPSHFSPTGEGKGQVLGVSTARLPVDRVTWYEATAFCDRLSEIPAEKQAGRTYRLPTEAEWEYACRGGACSTTPYNLGATLTSRQANFDGHHPRPPATGDTYLMRTEQVGAYPPNVFGLYDMHGNLWEWCADWFDESYYRRSPRCDPPGPETGDRRVLRGGAYWNWGSCCRCARRVRNTPDAREQAYGFRVAMTMHATR